MADQTVKVILKGEDQTGDSFKLVGNKMKGLNTDVSGLAKTLGLTVVGAAGVATAALISFAKVAADDEEAISRVTSTLKIMGEGALKNKEAILQMSQAAVKLGFDDESAAESITKFYQRTNDLTVAQQAAGLAMDYARFKQISLEEATSKMNLALSGSPKILNELGLSVSDTASQLDILNAIQGKVGGTAENVSGSFKVQMEVMNESINNLKSTVGAAFLEAIMPFVVQLTTWASNPDVQKKVAEIAKGIGTFASTYLPVAIESAKILFGWISSLVDKMTKFGEAILWVVDNIMKLVRAVSSVPSKAGQAVNKVLSGAASELQFLTGARASGGPVLAGGSYLVGEQGPEIFTPQSSGMIFANGQSGGGLTINISGNTLLDKSAGEIIARQIMDGLKGNLRI